MENRAISSLLHSHSRCELYVDKAVNGMQNNRAECISGLWLNSTPIKDAQMYDERRKYTEKSCFSIM